MDIGNFLKLVETFTNSNFSAIVGAITFLFIYVNAKHFKRALTELLKLHGEKYKKQVKSFSKIIDVNNYVLDLMNSLLEDIGCSRIVIMQYHNGGYALNGVDFTKMSCTHEVIKRPNIKSLRPVQTTLLNIPITAYSFFTRHLRKESTIYVPDINNIKYEDISTFDEFKSHGAKSFICTRITNSANDLTGFMVFEYVKSCSRIKPELLSLIEHYAIRISGMLESAGVYEENYNGAPNQTKDPYST